MVLQDSISRMLRSPRSTKDPSTASIAYPLALSYISGELTCLWFLLISISPQQGLAPHHDHDGISARAQKMVKRAPAAWLIRDGAAVAANMDIPLRAFPKLPPEHRQVIPHPLFACRLCQLYPTSLR